MKKVLLMTLAMVFLFGTLAFAAGGKNQGDIGQGDPDPVRDPMPIEWPGIDW